MFNGLENGGPAGLIYGYLFVWCGAILQALVMAEMASMYVYNRDEAFTFIPCCGYYATNYTPSWLSLRSAPGSVFVIILAAHSALDSSASQLGHMTGICIDFRRLYAGL